MRHTHGGFLAYFRARVFRLGRGRFELDTLGSRSLSQSGTSFYYTGINCWHPKGQTRLVIPTAAVLEACAVSERDGYFAQSYEVRRSLL